jgi:ribosome-binding factor A
VTVRPSTCGGWEARTTAVRLGSLWTRPEEKSVDVGQSLSVSALGQATHFRRGLERAWETVWVSQRARSGSGRNSSGGSGRGSAGRGGSRGYARTSRVNESLREIIAEELERIGDDRLHMVTVTGITVDSDFGRATVWFSALAREGDEAMIAEAFAENRVALQGAVGRQVRLKRTPLLSFAADPAILNGQKIESIIRDLPPRAPEMESDELDGDDDNDVANELDDQSATDRDDQESDADDDNDHDADEHEEAFLRVVEDGDGDERKFGVRA